MSEDDFLETKIREIAATHELPLGVFRDALGTFIGVLHEMEFKPQVLPSLSQIYFSLGNKAAWHYMGLALEILEHDSRYVSDLRDNWLETAGRLDPGMKRFRTILDQWKEESEQQDSQQQD